MMRLAAAHGKQALPLCGIVSRIGDFRNCDSAASDAPSADNFSQMETI
jgi:hypothetical protein